MRRPSSPGRILVLLTMTLLISTALIAFAQDGSGDSQTPLSGTISYTVKSNDTLDTIGARFDVSVACIVEQNHVETPGLIFPGDTLTISDQCPLYNGDGVVLNPRAERAALQDAAAPTPEIAGGQSYTVKANDTLDTIAQRFDVSLQALIAANESIKPNRIMPGMSLIIPADAPPYGIYGIPAGGDQGGGVTRPDEKIYVVQPGDVLDLLAASFGAQMSCIVERNSLKRPWQIYPGQTIIIPASCPSYDGYSFVLTPNPDAILSNPLAAGSARTGASTPIPLTPQPLALISPTPEQLSMPAPTAMAPASTVEAQG